MNGRNGDGFVKRKILLVGIFIAIVLVGCGQSIYPELPKNAVAFDMKEITDETDDDTLYGTFEYNGRTYMGYGTLAGTLKDNDIEACLGYLVQDGEDSTDYRVYTLSCNTNNDYLMIYVDGVMNQPDFWRAIDTRGVVIDTPEYIDSLGYVYWE